MIELALMAALTLETIWVIPDSPNDHKIIYQVQAYRIFPYWWVEDRKIWWYPKDQRIPGWRVYHDREAAIRSVQLGIENEIKHLQERAKEETSVIELKPEEIVE